MFTGIVSELGEVASLGRAQGGAVLRVRLDEACLDAAPGDSIAINGACLTATSIEGRTVSFDLSDETLRATTLGALRPGHRVNVEAALRVGGRLGGHFVTGHVDAVGSIRSKRALGGMLEFTVEAPAEVMRLLVPKGSVAVDGISLTVVEVLDGAFTLVIIPHTARLTTLGFKGAGDAVNLESDMLGKYVMRIMGLGAGGAAEGKRDLMSLLSEHGFAS